MEVGHVVREARRRRGLSQGQLATLAGTAQSAISRVERDRISPTIETLERLVSATGEQLVVGLGPERPDAP